MTASKVDIPFDLNKIFTLSYGFEPLKEVIEHIYGQLSKNASKTNEVDMKLATKLMQIET